MQGVWGAGVCEVWARVRAVLYRVIKKEKKSTLVSILIIFNAVKVENQDGEWTSTYLNEKIQIYLIDADLAIFGQVGTWSTSEKILGLKAAIFTKFRCLKVD